MVFGISQSPKTIYSLFNKVQNNRTKKGSGRNRRSSAAENWDVEDFFNEVLNVESFPVEKEVKSRIMRLSDNQAMQVLTRTSHHLTNTSTTVNSCNEFLLYVIKDIALHKLSRHHKDHEKKGLNSYFVMLMV